MTDKDGFLTEHRTPYEDNVMVTTKQDKNRSNLFDEKRFYLNNVQN